MNDSFPQRPFCSDRCKTIDFGGWANESNSIAGDEVLDNSEEDLWSDDLT